VRRFGNVVVFVHSGFFIPPDFYGEQISSPNKSRASPIAWHRRSNA
jgi:hypothetical protein